MTTPLIIEDLNGEVYAVQTYVKEREVLNNEKEIEFLLLENDETENFIEDVQTGYLAHFRGNEYWIYDPVYELVDDRLIIQCKATHDFFRYFNGFYTQETWEDQSMTPVNSIMPYFENKKYTAHLQSSLYHAVMNSQRNITYTERILYAVGRHDAEFKLEGTNFYINSKIGNYRDDMILHPDINIKDVKKEVDSAGLATWAKGYWGKVKDENGSETDEYAESTTEVHPFLVSIYGTEGMEGEAIYNDSIQYEDVMKEAIIAKLDETFVLKHTMSIHEYNDPEKFKSVGIGDTLPVVIDKFDEEIDMRVLEINREWLNEELQEMTITIGNGGAKAEYRSVDSDILIEDIMRGRREIPYSAYNDGVRRATALINGDLNGNFRYMPDGVYGINPDNPNHRAYFGIEGLAYMTDGVNWNNALTYEGLTASAIYTGTLRADLIDIRGTDGRLYIMGDLLTLRNNSGTRWMDIQYGEIESFYNGDLAMKFGGYSLEFYNQRNSMIGAISPIYSLGSRRPGLGIAVQEEIINIGYIIGGIYRPVFRSDMRDELDSKPITTVNGPYNNANEGSRLGLYANRRIVSSDTEFANDYNAWDQPSLILDQSNSTNHFTQYFGGVNNRNTAEWRVRWRSGQDTYASRIIATSDGVEVRGEFNQGSSIEYKENIEPLTESALDVINGLEVVKYNLKDTANVVEEVGLISEHSPAVASRDGKSVNLYKKSSYQTKAIQELHDMYKDLNKKVEEITNGK